MTPLPPVGKVKVGLAKAFTFWLSLLGLAFGLGGCASPFALFLAGGDELRGDTN